jgi:hypothetical protein
MRTKTPTVWEDLCTGEARLEEGPRLDSPGWRAWLSDPATTSFAYPVYNARQGYIEGFMTVRKERRQRGGSYWTAYWRVGGRLRKVYLGACPAVTAARLQAIAVAWLAQALAAPGAEEEIPRPDAPRIEGARLATETSGAGRAKPGPRREGR